MNEKVRRYLIIGIAALVIIGGVFFAGRATGRGSMAAAIRNAETALSHAIADRDAILKHSRRLIENVGGMADGLDRLETILSEFDGNFSAGIQQLDGTIGRIEDTYQRYVQKLDELDHVGGEFIDASDAGIQFIESVEKAISGGSD